MKVDERVLRRRAWLLFFLAAGVWATFALAGGARTSFAEDAAKPAAAAEEQTQAEPENYLVWVAKTSGLIGLVILGLSVYFVSTVGRLFWELRLPVAVPPNIIQQCEALLEQRDFKGIYSLVKDDDSFFSRVLTTGIRELPNGLPEARDAMERQGDALTVEMEKKISMLAVLGTLGPMIGLLGTLKGMISSFGEISRSAGTQIKSHEVAKGISEALLLTFEGVGLSVPAIYFFALFRNRVAFISTSAMLSADEFLRHFSQAGRVKSAAAAPASKPLKS